MLGSSDDLILKITAQIIEVIAVPCNPNNQVPVFFWIFLSITKCFRVHYIKLNVMTVHAKVSPDQSDQLGEIVISSQ